MTSTNTDIRKGTQTRETSSAHAGVRTGQPRKKNGVAVVSCKQAVKSADNHIQYGQMRLENSTSVDKRKLSTIAGSSPNSKHHPARNTGRHWKKGTMQQRAFLLDLPDELLLLIVQETARRGAVKIKAPERRRKRASGTDKMQPPIYHLSLVSRRIRSVCWEFLFQNIEFSLRCDTHGYISEGDMAYLKQKFQDHRPNVLESIRRISFSSAEPEVHCVFEMDYKIHQFQPFALDIIRLCPNLCRISLPAFYSLNQLCQHEALLQAASEHSPNLLVVYHELGRDPGFGDISRPLSRVVLSSLDTSRCNYRTTNWTKRLLERGLRVEKLYHSVWYSEWYPWSCFIYPSLRSVTGWRVSGTLVPLQDFLRSHPLLQTLEVNVQEENMKQLSDCWLVAIPGVAKLLDNFPFRSSLHYSILYSLTLIRRTDSWRVEEVHVWYVCDWELQDNISAMAKNLRSILPAQIHRVSIQKPEVSANGLAYAASVLTKQGLSVRWR